MALSTVMKGLLFCSLLAFHCSAQHHTRSTQTRTEHTRTTPTTRRTTHTRTTPWSTTPRSSPNPTSPTTFNPVTSPASTPSTGFNIDAFRQDALVAHNQDRALHSAPPLVLVDALNTYAQGRAANLASIGQLTHAGLSNSYGENLYMYQSSDNSAPTGEMMTQSWYDEISMYNFNNPGFSDGTGHFTQLVWKSSTQVGFGIAQASDGAWYTSAIYAPPGNWDGEYPANVLPS